MEPIGIENTDVISILSKFKAGKEKLFKKAMEKTTDVNVLVKMYKYPVLSERLLFRCTMLTTDIYTILRVAKESNNNTKDSQLDNIIINFLDLGIYALFSYTNYEQFFISMTEEIESDRMQKSDIKLCQVVLTGQKQKIVLACTDISYYNKLKKYIEECFKVTPSLHNDQITIELFMNSERELEEKFDKLQAHIQNKDQKCVEFIKLITLLRAGADKYRNYNCDEFPEYSADVNMEYICKILKTHSSIHNVNININNNCVIGNNNIVNQLRTTKPDRIQSARGWIQNNNPANGESTADYYEKYRTSNHFPLIHNEFGPIVRDVLKREPVRGKLGRHW